MTKKLILTLLLLVCLPLALVVWAGVWLARHEEDLSRQRFGELLTDQLRDTDQIVARHFQRCERDLLRLTDLQELEASHLRDIVRSEPLVAQLFVLEADGRLLHPPLAGPLNDAERAFLQRAERFLLDKDLIRAASPSAITSALGEKGAPGVTDGSGQVSLREQVSTDSASTHGWYVWYWERGFNLVFWHRAETGPVVGIELDRSRWIADLISNLPTTAVAENVPASQSRIRLVDSNASVIYQWGDFEPSADDSPAQEMPLSTPLTSWRLQYFVEGEHLIGVSKRTTYFSILSGLVAVAICLIGLAVYFYRESSRELREAATRVNFVNQVSHELRTDDFIVKPFGVKEVVARIRAVTRRCHSSRAEPSSSSSFTMGGLDVYPGELRARRGDQVIELSLRDVKILNLLYRHRGSVLDRNTIFNHCWGQTYLPNSRTLDQHISQLRKRIEIDAKDPQVIRTVHGVGYRFDG